MSLKDATFDRYEELLCEFEELLGRDPTKDEQADLWQQAEDAAMAALYDRVELDHDHPEVRE